MAQALALLNPSSIDNYIVTNNYQFDGQVEFKQNVFVQDSSLNDIQLNLTLKNINENNKTIDLYARSDVGVNNIAGFELYIHNITLQNKSYVSTNLPNWFMTSRKVSDAISLVYLEMSENPLDINGEVLLVSLNYENIADNVSIKNSINPSLVNTICDTSANRISFYFN